MPKPAQRLIRPFEPSHHGGSAVREQLPNPGTCSLGELERALDCGPDGKAHRRLNTIHLLLVGATYDVGLRYCRLSETTFRLWIARFNELGIDGLIYRPGCSRRRKLEPHVVSEIILPLAVNPSLAGQTHWTLTKLCGYLRVEKLLDLTYRILNCYLHKHR